jgi:Thioredoxin-like
LKDFYANNNRNIELIFISSDFDSSSSLSHFENKQGPWYALQFDDPLIDLLKKKYLVWSGRESGKYGIGRKSGIPTVIVINSLGEELISITSKSDLNKWASCTHSMIWRLSSE